MSPLFADNPEMGLLRDIANGFKHKDLKYPSHDPDFNLFREYDHFAADADPTHSPVSDWVAADVNGQLVKVDLFDLVERCHQLWSELLVALDEPAS